MVETFATSSEFLVRQKKEMLEILTGWESNNRYEIYNGQGQLVCYAIEDTGFGSRMCCGSERPFSIKLVLPQSPSHAIMTLQADIDMCGQMTRVCAPEGRHFGTIEKPYAFFTPEFTLSDANGQPQFTVSSPWGAVLGSLGDVGCPVKSISDGRTVASITKQWKGFMKELFTDADAFGVKFLDPNLDAAQRGLIMAAVFPVDFAFFESSG